MGVEFANRQHRRSATTSSKFSGLVFWFCLLRACSAHKKFCVNTCREEMSMTPDENVRLWLAHTAGEFTDRNEEKSLATMTEDASVLHVPTGSGGVGKGTLRGFYRDEFIPSIPTDWSITTTNRV